MCCLWLELLCVLLLISSSVTVGERIKPRIVGGQATTQTAVGGFVVNLRNNGAFTCGGSLVTPLYVVTAAHCVYGVPTSRLSVQGGVTKLSQAGVVRRVARYNIPQEYNNNNMNMDVAVLRLDSAMQGRNIATIPLCSAQWRSGNMMRVSGWGATRFGSSQTPTQLRTVQLRLISKSACQQLYGKTSIQPSSFCAHSSGKDSCTGDSGGGAIYNNQLCGIVSAGQGCASARYPGIYTSVHRARSFINGIINSG